MCLSGEDVLLNTAFMSRCCGLIQKVAVAEVRNVFQVSFCGSWHCWSVFSGRMIEQGTPAAIYNLGSENSLFVAVPQSVAMPLLDSAAYDGFAFPADFRFEVSAASLIESRQDPALAAMMAALQSG